MLSNGSNYTPSGSPIRLQQEGKFYRRLLSREAETGVGYYEDKSSGGVGYYEDKSSGGGVHGSVPFLWELEPGTPRTSINSTAASLPSLSPPPAYFFIADGKAEDTTSKVKKTKRMKKTKSSSRFRTAMAAILMRLRSSKDEECGLQFMGITRTSSSSTSGFGCKSSSSWPPMSSSKLDGKEAIRGGQRWSCLFCFWVGIEGVVA